MHGVLVESIDRLGSAWFESATQPPTPHQPTLTPQQPGLRVLRTPDAFGKARLTLQYAERYQQGSLPLPPTLPRPRAEVKAAVPDVPGGWVGGLGMVLNDS